MGRASKKKASFKAAHPVCCYCGTAPTATIDHAPARICFTGKVGPENYEFPACEECNHRGSKSEQVVALYIHSLTDATGDLTNLVRAVRNNYPELLPQTTTTLRQKVNYLSERKITLPGYSIPNLPLATIPEGVHAHFHYFTAKLARAFYYKHFSKPAGANFRVITHWTTNQQTDFDDFMKSVLSIQPLVEVGMRSNQSIGEQFVYRLNFAPDYDVMVFTASFSGKIILTGLCADKDFGISFEDFLKLPSWREPDLARGPD